MNLRSIYLTCIKYKMGLKGLDAQTMSVNGRVVRRVEGWPACRSAIMELKKVPALTQECEDLMKAIPSMFQPLDTFDLRSEEWEKISDERDYLYRTVIDIIDLCEKLGMEENETDTGLDIKLPHYNDFSEFTSYVNDIEFILTKCPFLQDKDEKFEFKNVDVGSTWLSFVVEGMLVVGGASVLLNNLAAFVDKCIIIRSHYLSVEKQKLELEHQEYTQAEKEAIIKYISNSHKELVKHSIEELERISQYAAENKDGDEILRIEQCMDRMGILIEKGLQIHASIDAPPETKLLFDPLEMKYIDIEKKMKLLETQKDSDVQE